MVYAALQAGYIPNHKIVVPSVGWVTTISPAMQLGLEPIMCGADPDTFGMDLDQLEEICKEHRPDAVIFVQVLGVPHYRERLLELKKKYKFCYLKTHALLWVRNTLTAKSRDSGRYGFILLLFWSSTVHD